ncbi:Dolichyl-diphosphooligosaccharide--protein glycosyltransferase subunit WBP1 [Carpediemonas membranifera]|uniref:Dolichyl-diphosphooligosaccharide--protein glycosyltransferase subunit WBP1 n=1 Tax=Carpediemonas membranifera TaxID=201153 RepID=A0A8J6E4K4_9EUKA|nr:Dolichyl-diphosphooligosaccharide--protein glycosyltransferase subunit WBP1 [Carpediemonas membranifera]|eukprot:KAG9397298.1 Dolichyl-diphosphooligosaccharide--protein glycosyltransferase subunit WBP1 [Carpediemonas membranifera]
MRVFALSLALLLAFSVAQKVGVFFDGEIADYNALISHVGKLGNEVATHKIGELESKLIVDGSSAYDTICVIVPSESLSATAIAALEKHLDKHAGNMYLAFSHTVDMTVRRFLFSHFNVKAGTKEVTAFPRIHSGSPILPKKIDAEAVKYSGIAMFPQSFSGKFPLLYGDEVVGAIATQGHANNARVVLLGSTLPITNTGMADSPTRQFVAATLGWTMGYSGKLRIAGTTHSRVGASHGGYDDAGYAAGDYIEWGTTLEQFIDGRWEPFTPTDAQVELVCMDVWARETLAPSNTGLAATIRAPEKPGVYKFVLDYERVGYSRLHDEEQVQVRQPKDSFHPRFESQAWPYYGSVLAVSFMFVAFVALYLNSAPVSKKVEEDKKDN